ncbi:MAG: hypothetical protein OXG44_10690 [Gammaproteobacteria bacterium]|nr:hypothetical protein [Gammaproteobacteria bacterium]
MADEMLDVRAQWAADYRITGARRSKARRRAAERSARTRRQRGAHGQTAHRGLLRAFKPVIPAAQAAIQLATLEVLQGPESQWPVDTGYSLAGFGFLGQSGELTNRADYARDVEDRTGAILRTLSENDDTIAERADALLAARIMKGLE